MKNEYSGTMQDYINMETERMANQPEMAMFKDDTVDLIYILVRDTQENVEKFQNYLKKYNKVPDNVLIFYNESPYYELAIDGYQTRFKIKEEKERQEKINNPKVDLNINGKHELIDFLVFNLIDKEEALIEEYSTDLEVSEAQLKAKAKELRRLVDKYLY